MTNINQNPVLTANESVDELACLLHTHMQQDWGHGHWWTSMQAIPNKNILIDHYTDVVKSNISLMGCAQHVHDVMRLLCECHVFASLMSHRANAQHLCWICPTYVHYSRRIPCKMHVSHTFFVCVTCVLPTQMLHVSRA
jgi:hypothetical protein